MSMIIDAATLVGLGSMPAWPMLGSLAKKRLPAAGIPDLFTVPGFFPPYHGKMFMALSTILCGIWGGIVQFEYERLPYHPGLLLVLGMAILTILLYLPLQGVTRPYLNATKGDKNPRTVLKRELIVLLLLAFFLSFAFSLTYIGHAIENGLKYDILRGRVVVAEADAKKPDDITTKAYEAWQKYQKKICRGSKVHVVYPTAKPESTDSSNRGHKNDPDRDTILGRFSVAVEKGTGIEALLVEKWTPPNSDIVFFDVKTNDSLTGSYCTVELRPRNGDTE